MVSTVIDVRDEKSLLGHPPASAMLFSAARFIFQCFVQFLFNSLTQRGFQHFPWETVTLLSMFHCQLCMALKLKKKNAYFTSTQPCLTSKLSQVS